MRGPTRGSSHPIGTVYSTRRSLRRFPESGIGCTGMVLPRTLSRCSQSLPKYLDAGGDSIDPFLTLLPAFALCLPVRRTDLLSRFCLFIKRDASSSFSPLSLLSVYSFLVCPASTMAFAFSTMSSHCMRGTLTLFPGKDFECNAPTSNGSAFLVAVSAVRVNVRGNLSSLLYCLKTGLTMTANLGWLRYVLLQSVPFRSKFPL
jgi:hypothetical protein